MARTHRVDGEQMRERIIRSARQVLSRRGYEQTAIKDIARHARVAPGLVHYYFEDKDALIVAVIRELERELVTGGAAASRRKPRGKQGRGALDPARARLKRNPTWFRLRYDLFALALRSKRLRPHVSTLLESGREQTAEALTAAHPTRLAKKPAEADLLAAILNAAFEGLALQKLLEPEFPLDRAYALLTRMGARAAKGR